MWFNKRGKEQDVFTGSCCRFASESTEALAYFAFAFWPRFFLFGKSCENPREKEGNIL